MGFEVPGLGALKFDFTAEAADGLTRGAESPSRALPATWGHRIVNRLAKDDGVELVLATDAVTPSESYGSKVVFRRYDVTEPTGTLLADFEIDSLVHLAFILEPRRNRAEVRRVNVDGAANVLEGCGRAPVSHLLYLSSTSVYGAHRDNPDELTEDSPARPVRGFQYSEDKLEAEKLFSAYGREHPDCGVAILRACPVLGPKADNYIARSFLTPVLVGFMGEDPPMQFIHEDDLVEIMARCVLERVPGLYNAAGRGTVRWSRMARMLGRPRLSLPGPLLTGLTWAELDAGPAVGVTGTRTELCTIRVGGQHGEAPPPPRIHNEMVLGGDVGGVCARARRGPAPTRREHNFAGLLRQAQDGVRAGSQDRLPQREIPLQTPLIRIRSDHPSIRRSSDEDHLRYGPGNRRCAGDHDGAELAGHRGPGTNDGGRQRLAGECDQQRAASASLRGQERHPGGAGRAQAAGG